MNYDDHGEDLQRFADYKPTTFDQRGLGSEGQEDWRVLPTMQTRDSQPIDLSNFEAATRLLDDAGAEYDVHRFGHWGPGWFEIIVVKPTRLGLRTAGEIVCSLEDYPVLDEDDLSEREDAAAYESWGAWACTDFVAALDLTEHTADWLYDHSDALWYYAAPEYETHADGAHFRTPGISRDQTAKLLLKIRNHVRTEGVPE